jgi:hypothetical protein
VIEFSRSLIWVQESGCRPTTLVTNKKRGTLATLEQYSVIDTVSFYNLNMRMPTKAILDVFAVLETGDLLTSGM